MKNIPESDEDVEIYKEALANALVENNDINNFALTDSYNTGKSTTINSYIQNYCLIFTCVFI